MKYVGAHVSISGGIENAPQNAVEIGAKAFALFTRNQRQWISKPLAEDSVKKFKSNFQQLGFEVNHILPHDIYLTNLGSPEAEGLKKSRIAFLDEMKRCQQLGLIFLNFHPGSHKKRLTDHECLDIIADSVNITLAQTKGVTAVIENTSGQGGDVGYRFEHLAYLIDKVEYKSRIGVCLDTCHTFSSGYDIRTPSTYEKTMADFDQIVGFQYLKGMHLNDSKVPLGSRKDRHHNLGKGELGWEPFRFIMNDPRLDNIPLVLETIDESLWAEEIKTLYNMIR